MLARLDQVLSGTDTGTDPFLHPIFLTNRGIAG